MSLRKRILLNQWPATEEQTHSRLLMMRQRLQQGMSCWQAHQLSSNSAEVEHVTMDDVYRGEENEEGGLIN